MILDVQQFKPDEITVKTNEKEITVEAKHEEQADEHGQVYRHFIRRYALPSKCIIQKNVYVTNIYVYFPKYTLTNIIV